MIQHNLQSFTIHISGSKADNKRNSVTIHHNRCLLPGRPRSTRLGPVSSPLFCLGNRAINTGSAPVDLFHIMQTLQDGMVKVLPNTSFLPILKSAPEGQFTAVAHLLRQIFPWYPCLENKDDSDQSCPVRYTSMASFGRRLIFWQEWFNLTPQFVTY